MAMHEDSRAFAYAGGCVCMFFAVGLTVITLAGGGYARVLLLALAFTAAADACFLISCWRARWPWKVAAAVGGLPTIWVVSDFAHRF